MDKRTVSQDLSSSRDQELQGRTCGNYPLIMESDVIIISYIASKFALVVQNSLSDIVTSQFVCPWKIL